MSEELAAASGGDVPVDVSGLLSEGDNLVIERRPVTGYDCTICGEGPTRPVRLCDEHMEDLEKATRPADTHSPDVVEKALRIAVQEHHQLWGHAVPWEDCAKCADSVVGKGFSAAINRRVPAWGGPGRQEWERRRFRDALTLIRDGDYDITDTTIWTPEGGKVPREIAREALSTDSASPGESS